MQRIILFGDSITAGATHGFPTKIFTDKIAQAIAPQNVELINRGVLGDNTVGGLGRMKTDVLQKKPDIVVIFFGTNDVELPQMTLKKYQQNLATMLTKIGPQKCILVTPGITGPTRQGHRPNKLLYQYAKATKETAQKYGALCVDWFAQAIRHPASEILQADDLHYGPKAYDLLVKELKPLLLQKLVESK